MSERVLVVDDSGTMRKIIIRALNGVGYTDIVEAGDGVEALAKFREQGFHLVLTDWNMPNKSGIELTRDIRAMGSSVPIIIVTTEGERSRVLEAISAGASSYLMKPFTADVLREKLLAYAN